MQPIQNLVRPSIALSMTVVFCVLFLTAAFGLLDKRFNEIFTAYMGVYGIVIGFYFGERSALKIPGKEEEQKDESKQAKTIPGAVG